MQLWLGRAGSVLLEFVTRPLHKAALRFEVLPSIVDEFSPLLFASDSEQEVIQGTSLDIW